MDCLCKLSFICSMLLRLLKDGEDYFANLMVRLVTNPLAFIFKAVFKEEQNLDEGCCFRSFELFNELGHVLNAHSAHSPDRVGCEFEELRHELCFEQIVADVLGERQHARYYELFHFEECTFNQLSVKVIDELQALFFCE